MADTLAAQLWRRQNDDDGFDSATGAPISSADAYNDHDNYPYDRDNWWWSDTGMAVRYTIICVIFALILLYFVGGYFHAQRRLKKGLQPFSYHRWMVRSRVRYRDQYHPPYQQDPYQRGYEGYAMHGYPPPPPAYQPPHRDAPPAYTPPEGASKAMADQNYSYPPEPPLRTGNEGEGSQSAAAPPRL